MLLNNNENDYYSHIVSYLERSFFNNPFSDFGMHDVRLLVVLNKGDRTSK